MTVAFIPHQERVRQQQTSTLSIPYILIISIFYTFPFSSYLLQHYTFLYRHSVTNFHQTEHSHSFFLQFIFSILSLSTCISLFWVLYNICLFLFSLFVLSTHRIWNYHIAQDKSHLICMRPPAQQSLYILVGSQ